ncbi:MAG: hypothetical protein LBQ76_09975 [Candidatus Fibromonas sp.]|nr:hypothetical protein [Candidatus Fibromonas sp.]
MYILKKENYVKKYSLYFMLLLLAASLIVFGACGSGQIVDLSRNSDEYREVYDARNNLTDEGGLIEHCSGKSQGKEECEEFHKVYYSSSEMESSSSEELSSSSRQPDNISSSRISSSNRPSSSSVAPAAPSSSSVRPPSSSSVRPPSSSSVRPPSSSSARPPSSSSARPPSSSSRPPSSNSQNSCLKRNVSPLDTYGYVPPNPTTACLEISGKCYRCKTECSQPWLWFNQPISNDFFQEITCP